MHFCTHQTCIYEVFHARISVSSEVYVDKGYPYLDGPFGTGWFFVTETGDRSPLHSIVFYPNQPGDYAVYYFIPGAGGYVEAELYTEYLSRVASHG